MAESSPDMFPDEDNTSNLACNENIDDTEMATTEENILKKMQAMLEGIPPPPSRAICKMTCGQMLESWHLNNHLHCFAFAKSGLEKKTTPRFNYMNSTNTSELIAELSMKLVTRYVQSETASSYTFWRAQEYETNSARKRRIYNGISPGRRLSHLARRRQIFSKANLQQMSQQELKNRITVKTRSFPRNVVKDGAIAKPSVASRNLPKRALFQSPDEPPVRPGYKTLPRRRLFGYEDHHVEQSLPGGGGSYDVSGWLASQPFCNGKKRTREDSEEGDRKRRCPRRSLDFSDGSPSSDSTARSQNHIVTFQKDKLLWAVATVMKEKKISMSKSNFKPCASALYKACKKNLPSIVSVRDNRRTSEKVLEFARANVNDIMDTLGIKQEDGSINQKTVLTDVAQSVLNRDSENRVSPCKGKENITKTPTSKVGFRQCSPFIKSPGEKGLRITRRCIFDNIIEGVKVQDNNLLPLPTLKRKRTSSLNSIVEMTPTKVAICKESNNPKHIVEETPEKSECDYKETIYNVLPQKCDRDVDSLPCSEGHEPLLCDLKRETARYDKIDYSLTCELRQNEVSKDVPSSEDKGAEPQFPALTKDVSAENEPYELLQNEVSQYVPCSQDEGDEHQFPALTKDVSAENEPSSYELLQNEVSQYVPCSQDEGDEPQFPALTKGITAENELPSSYELLQNEVSEYVSCSEDEGDEPQFPALMKCENDKFVKSFELRKNCQENLNPEFNTVLQHSSPFTLQPTIDDGVANFGNDPEEKFDIETYTQDTGKVFQGSENNLKLLGSHSDPHKPDLAAPTALFENSRIECGQFIQNIPDGSSENNVSNGKKKLNRQQSFSLEGYGQCAFGINERIHSTRYDLTPHTKCEDTNIILRADEIPISEDLNLNSTCKLKTDGPSILQLEVIKCKNDIDVIGHIGKKDIIDSKNYLDEIAVQSKMDACHLPSGHINSYTAENGATSNQNISDELNPSASKIDFEDMMHADIDLGLETDNIENIILKHEDLSVIESSPAKNIKERETCELDWAVHDSKRELTDRLDELSDGEERDPNEPCTSTPFITLKKKLVKRPAWKIEAGPGLKVKVRLSKEWDIVGRSLIDSACSTATPSTSHDAITKNKTDEEVNCSSYYAAGCDDVPDSVLKASGLNDNDAIIPYGAISPASSMESYTLTELRDRLAIERTLDRDDSEFLFLDSDFECTDDSSKIMESFCSNPSENIITIEKANNRDSDVKNSKFVDELVNVVDKSPLRTSKRKSKPRKMNSSSSKGNIKENEQKLLIASDEDTPSKLSVSNRTSVIWRTPSKIKTSNKESGETTRHFLLSPRAIPEIILTDTSENNRADTIADDYDEEVPLSKLVSTTLETMSSQNVSPNESTSILDARPTVKSPTDSNVSQSNGLLQKQRDNGIVEQSISDGKLKEDKPGNEENELVNERLVNHLVGGHSHLQRFDSYLAENGDHQSRDQQSERLFSESITITPSSGTCTPNSDDNSTSNEKTKAKLSLHAYRARKKLEMESHNYEKPIRYIRLKPRERGHRRRKDVECTSLSHKTSATERAEIEAQSYTDNYHKVVTAFNTITATVQREMKLTVSALSNPEQQIYKLKKLGKVNSFTEGLIHQFTNTFDSVENNMD